MQHSPFWLCATGVCLIATTALAQATCPTIVRDALDTATQACQDTERNQICYGNVLINAIPQANSPDFQFAAPGDTVDLTTFQLLKLAPLDAKNHIWGIALIQAQANLPDTLPGQNVTLVLFGDVELTTDSDDQAFYLQTGIGDAPCNEAPDSGILVQTPENVQTIELHINDVVFEVGSTAYLQAGARGDLTAYTLEGSISVEALGQKQYIPAGGQVRIPLDATLHADQPPAPGEAYNLQNLEALPLDLLPRPIVIAPPLQPQYMPPCANGRTVTLDVGPIVLVASDGPNAPETAPLFSFSYAIDGIAVVPLNAVHVRGRAIEQEFGAGILPPGNYTVTFQAAVSQSITDPLGQTWGPEQWSATCTLIVRPLPD